MGNHKYAVEMIQLDWYKDHWKMGIDAVGLCLNYAFYDRINIMFSTLGSVLTLSMYKNNCTIVEFTPSMASFLLDDDTNNIHSIIVGDKSLSSWVGSKMKIFLNVFGPT